MRKRKTIFIEMGDVGICLIICDWCHTSYTVSITNSALFCRTWRIFRIIVTMATFDEWKILLNLSILGNLCIILYIVYAHMYTQKYIMFGIRLQKYCTGALVTLLCELKKAAL